MKHEIIAGLNPVLDAIAAGRAITRILVSRVEDRERILGFAMQKGIPAEVVNRRKLDAMVPGSHQGIVALAAPRGAVRMEDVLRQARSRGDEPLLVVLDGVEDPQNLGAVARTALAAGAAAVVVPERRSAGIGPGAMKASAGALSRIPVVTAGNLASCLRELKRADVWIGGSDPRGGRTYTDARLTGPLALVLGSEAAGLRPLTRELCDFTVAIPMRAGESLNVSVTAGILLYERLRQQALKV